MTDQSITAEEWRRIIKAIDGIATAGAVGEAVADARQISEPQAADLVEEALDVGILEEQDNGGMFPEVAVADDDDHNEPEDADHETDSDRSDRTQEAFFDAIAFFNAQLDRSLPGEESPETPRQHFVETRGWDAETIDDAMLGWAPADDMALLDHLMRQGYEREEILATGLFWDNSLEPIWKGRFVFPYFDADGKPCFAISRRYDGGHPADRAGQYGEEDDPAKYHKIPVSREYVAVSEPIYGVETVEAGEPVIITEGIADAITAHQHGYAALSPVTTQFKNEHITALREILEDADTDGVYIIQDSEPPQTEPREADGDAERIQDRLEIQQYGEGLRGAVRTAADLADVADLDVRLVELPRPSSDKIDLDDWLQEWGDLEPVLASAKPASQHDAYDPKEQAVSSAKRTQQSANTDDRDDDRGDAGTSLFDLDIFDVTGLSKDYRGKNPLGHHGDSENYYVFFEEGGEWFGYDHKYKTAYTPLTHLLCEMPGGRSSSAPNGSVSDEEIVDVWCYAESEGHLDEEVPYWLLKRAAIVDGIISREDLIERESDKGKYEGFPNAETYNDALEAIEQRGADPGRDPVDTSTSGESADPISTLPLGVLNAMDPDEARQFAQRRGHDWPTTDEARSQLRDRILSVVRAGQKIVLDAPTSLGKSHTTATIPWLNHADNTGESPVVHLHPTKDARDEAAAASSNAGAVSYAKLLGRDEACSCAAGHHDPSDDDEDDEEPDQVVTIDGLPASQWIQQMCEGRGVPFSVAHAYLREQNDQDLETLPCQADHVDEETGAGECLAIRQWNGVPYTEDGQVAKDVIHATHEFAYVPSLRRGTNVIMDERPDFVTDLSHDQVRRAVTAFLKEVDADIKNYERLMTVAREGLKPNEHDPRSMSQRYEELREQLDTQPDREWFIEADGAHVLAPALARAIAGAEERANGRLVGKVRYEPPRFDTDGNEDDYGGANWVTVVYDEDNNLRYVRDVPAFEATRSVVGLDAHPDTPVWRVNTHPDIDVEPVLDTEERRLWRFFERGLQVVQVGDATRPLSSGRYFDEAGTRTLAAHLREEYGDRFKTAITAKSVEDDLREVLAEVGVDIDDDTTMHYGEEKSRNDFADEDVGYLEGCIDPGDDYVLNLLAELDCDAEPEMTATDDGKKRAKGRGFVGEDAGTAQAILASVRESHVAQAAGRYARNPEDPEDRAVVFVRTDAMPTGYADVQVPGVEWVASEDQRAIYRALRDSRSATAAEIADEVGVSREHVRQSLKRLVDEGVVRAREHAGENGAHLYRVVVGGEAVEHGLTDLSAETSNSAVWGSYTFALEIQPPTAAIRSKATPQLARSGGRVDDRDEDQAGLADWPAD